VLAVLAAGIERATRVEIKILTCDQCQPLNATALMMNPEIDCTFRVSRLPLQARATILVRLSTRHSHTGRAVEIVSRMSRANRLLAQVRSISGFIIKAVCVKKAGTGHRSGILIQPVSLASIPAAKTANTAPLTASGCGRSG